MPLAGTATSRAERAEYPAQIAAGSIATDTPRRSVGVTRRACPAYIRSIERRESDRARNPAGAAGSGVVLDELTPMPISNPTEIFARYRVDVAKSGGAHTQEASSAQMASPTLKHGPLELDLERYRLSVDGHVVRATACQLRLLEPLMRKPERVFTRPELLVHVGSHEASDQAIDVHVCRLRDLLGRAGALIETVRGLGYRLRR